MAQRSDGGAVRSPIDLRSPGLKSEIPRLRSAAARSGIDRGSIGDRSEISQPRGREIGSGGDPERPPSAPSPPPAPPPPSTVSLPARPVLLPRQAPAGAHATRLAWALSERVHGVYPRRVPRIRPHARRGKQVGVPHARPCVPCSARPPICSGRAFCRWACVPHGRGRVPHTRRGIQNTHSRSSYTHTPG